MVLLFFLFLFPFSIFAMETPEALPLFQFDNNQQGSNQRTFYLLATHHATGYDTLPSVVRTQIESCKRIYVEQGPETYNPEQPSAPIDFSPGLRDQKNPQEDWCSKISSSSQVILRSLITEDVLQNLQNFRPQFAYMQLALLFGHKERSMGMDQTLGGMFFTQRKPVHGLCNDSQLLEVVGSIALTIESIDKAIAYIGEHREEFFSIKPYTFGDLELLEKHFNSEVASQNPIQNFSNQVCIKRTHLFVERLLKDSSHWQEPSAVAMGEDHLITRNGIIALFQEKGWSVRRLANNEDYVLVKSFQ